MTPLKDPGVAPFNRDVAANQGYLYTTNASLSSFLANRRLTDAALAAVDFRGKRVLDVGCGDGAYTLELFDRGRPATMRGIDPAHEAVQVARRKKGDRPIRFDVQGADALPYEADSFDLVHVRGVLHHTDRPVDTLREAIRVAPTVIVIEPNGYNPVLKLLERFSRYHIEHRERSFAPVVLKRWVHGVGGTVRSFRYAGLVPFFCPDRMARVLKLLEPVVERAPLVRALSCAVGVYVIVRG
jgi:ubiquinone/menaquinone biosynthesis C-methylase UbiE